MSYDGYVKRILLPDSSIASNLSGSQDPMNWRSETANYIHLIHPLKVRDTPPNADISNLP